MRSDRPDRRERLVTDAPKITPSSRHAAPHSEEILIRNYDHQWSYDVDLAVRDDEGETVFVKRYYLPPQQTEAEIGQLEPGEYEVEVTLDNAGSTLVETRIDGRPANTVLIELGNGILSITEGRDP